MVSLIKSVVTLTPFHPNPLPFRIVRTKTERPLVALFAAFAVVLCLGLLMASWQVNPLEAGNTASAIESSAAPAKS